MSRGACSQRSRDRRAQYRQRCVALGCRDPTASLDSSRQAGELVEHQAAGYGDVEAGADADHRDLHALVGQHEDVVGNALVLVAEKAHGRHGRGLEAGEGGGAVRELTATSRLPR